MTDVECNALKITQTMQCNTNEDAAGTVNSDEDANAIAECLSEDEGNESNAEDEMSDDDDEWNHSERWYSQPHFGYTMTAQGPDEDNTYLRSLVSAFSQAANMDSATGVLNASDHLFLDDEDDVRIRAFPIQSY